MVKKLIKRIRKKPVEPPTRITSSTIDEHREAVLSKGRRFKYPIQYTKHKLVINTIIISTLAIVAICATVWFQLYRAQSTGDIVFRITQFVPLSVARIDDQNVRYSDYLMQLRSSITALEHQLGHRLDDSEDARHQLEMFKRIALDNSIKNAYVIKLARELDIRIDRDQIRAIFDEHRTSGGVEITEANFIRIIRDNYGLSRSEYERMFIELPLLKQAVQVAIDDRARALVEELESRLLPDGSNFDLITGEFAGRITVESSGTLVPSTNLDGGRAAQAIQLEPGQVSAPFLSRAGNNFFIVRTIQRQDDRVEYISISVPLTELQRRIDEHREAGRIREFITIGFQFE